MRKRCTWPMVHFVVGPVAFFCCCLFPSWVRALRQFWPRRLLSIAIYCHLTPITRFQDLSHFWLLTIFLEHFPPCRKNWHLISVRFELGMITSVYLTCESLDVSVVLLSFGLDGRARLGLPGLLAFWLWPRPAPAQAEAFNCSLAKPGIEVERRWKMSKDVELVETCGESGRRHGDKFRH